MTMMHRDCVAAMAVAMVSAGAMAQTATSFTYQGLLRDGGGVVNGTFDARFRLFTLSSGGAEIGSANTQLGLSAVDGVFSTTLDFGLASTLQNGGLWLGIEIRRPSGSGEFVPLSGRQPVTPTPFSSTTRGLFVDELNRLGVGRVPDSVITARGTNFGGEFRVVDTPQSVGTQLLADLFVPGSSGAQMRFRNGTASFWDLGANASGNFLLKASNATRIVVTQSGLVGLGTLAPASALEIRNDSNPSITVGTNSLSDGQIYLGNSAHGLRRNYRGTTNDVGLFTTSANLRFSAAGPNATQMTLTNGGVLDIGGRVTAAPTGNGATDGSIQAFRSTGSVVGLISGFGTGYQIAVANSTGTALTASMFTTYATNQGTLTANVKSFVEPNPRDPSTDIYYACLEGPEAAMYTRGTASLVNGRAVISLPQHFADLASSQGLTVMLTPLSADSRGLAVVQKSVGGFEVLELMKGAGSYSFDWEVKAVRKQHLDFQVQRPWTDRRVANPNVTDAQAWEIRKREVLESNRRAAALEAATVR
jgi:hypothetical protein